jgi:4-hydroxymandelate oxidase
MKEAPVTVLDYERLAQERLEPMTHAYYASGADGERTLVDNRAAFDRRKLHYRVLVDVSRRALGTTILGHAVRMPILVAPTAFHRLACEEGELATARAAARAGTLMVLSSLSNTDMEDVVREAVSHGGAVFFQLYVYKDRAVTEGLVRRAEAAGARALVLTVDAPRLGRRERDVRLGFRLPSGLAVRNLVPQGLGTVEHAPGESGLAAYFERLIDPSLSFRDLEWLRSITRLPIVVKGVVRPDDALRAVEHGASAVVVSNHGGRQLDGSPATLDVLERVARAVGDVAEVWMDGGVRRGTDVLTALALGAKAVLVGRPILWGLAADGADGAERVLSLLRDELDRAMTLAGTPSLAAITRDLVEP